MRKSKFQRSGKCRYCGKEIGKHKDFCNSTCRSNYWHLRDQEAVAPSVLDDGWIHPDYKPRYTKCNLCKKTFFSEWKSIAHCEDCREEMQAEGEDRQIGDQPFYLGGRYA